MERLAELINALQLEDISLKQGEPLLRHTSFAIGGPAAVMAFPASEAELRTTLRCAAELGIRPVILGAGTNVLAPDRGLDTLVIETRTRMNEIWDLGDGRFAAACGVPLSRLASYALEQGLTGLEFAHGIPGTVGGGVVMNAGAYGGELRQVALETTVLFLDGERRTYAGEDQGFAYRQSVFQTLPGVIVQTVFSLRPGDPAAIRAEMDRLVIKRRASQPLEFPSAGSVFKRPQGAYAAALIDQAGLKGRRVGGAQVSEKHAGFIVNRGGATAADVMALIHIIQDEVQAKSGIRLVPEVRLLEGL